MLLKSFSSLSFNYLSSLSWYLAKSLYILVCVHLLSALLTAFTEAFLSPPVLTHAHYSFLNFAILRVTMLGDVLGNLVDGIQKRLAKIWLNLCKEG